MQTNIPEKGKEYIRMDNESLIEKQIEIEERNSAQAYTKWLEEQKDKGGECTALTVLLKRSLPHYAKEFPKEVTKNRALNKETIAFYNEVLTYLSIEDILYIAIRSIVTNEITPKEGTRKTKSQDLKNISDQIFAAIRSEYVWLRFKKLAPKRTTKSIIKNTSRTKDSKHKRTLLNTWVKRYLSEDIEFKPEEETKIIMRPLINVLCKVTPPVGPEGTNCVLFEVNTLHKNQGGLIIVKPTDATLQYVDNFNNRMVDHITRFVPMVVPPRDWSRESKGGYYTSICEYDLMHTMETRYEISQKVYDSVNNIQRTAWSVNTKILDVMKTIFEKGGEQDTAKLAGGIPNKHCILFDKKYMELVSQYNAVLFQDRHKKMSHYVPNEIWSEMPKYEELEDRKKYCKKYEWSKSKQENEWLRDQNESYIITLSNQISIAEEFKEYDKIYFPQFLDWRGRVYSTPIYLSPQSDKKGKSLLKFAKGEPLGKSGAFWLAVHGCNTYGKMEGVSIDKLPMEERAKWIQDHEKEIVSSAASPLTETFWQKADEDPWGFLAFCFEWKEYVESGYSEEFVSHLPVAMDATCSGLQHFSALMRDEVGGAEVNLIPNHIPKDIYKAVAKVAETKHEDFIKDPSKYLTKSDFKCLEKYSELEVKQLARLWGKEGSVIDRKLCKTPTMTTAYNVTISGVTDQVKELVKKGDKDISLDPTSTDPQVSSKIWYACRLMGSLVRESVFDVVKSARVAQKILGDCSDRITNIGEVVRWTTPIGLEVIQGYKNFKTKRINLFISGARLRLSIADRKQFKVNKSKSGAGTAPNYIHSLDACHLQMTVNSCVEKAGLEYFAFIHDSYAVHACKTNILMRILREEFVNLYSQEVLKDTISQWQQMYPEANIPDVDDSCFGKLDIQQVKSSKFFFS